MTIYDFVVLSTEKPANSSDAVTLKIITAKRPIWDKHDKFAVHRYTKLVTKLFMLGVDTEDIGRAVELLEDIPYAHKQVYVIGKRGKILIELEDN